MTLTNINGEGYDLEKDLPGKIGGILMSDSF
jgi:hypothetical protein